jgi:hypothetical protein
VGMTTQGGATGGVADGAGAKAREARDHPALEWPARLGVAAYGVVYLLVAWLSAQLALGDREGNASAEGALHEIAKQPLGVVVLWVVAAGFAALAVYEVFQAIGGHRDRDGAKRWASRAGSAGRVVFFAALAVTSVRIVTGDSGGRGTDSYTAQLMQLPFGPVLVVAAGLVVAGFGVHSVVKGVTDRWRRELEARAHSGDTGTAFAVLARVGFVARGLAFVVVGGLLGWAGLTHDADKSGGLDQALLKLRDAPFGPALLLAVAVGFACYGAFNVVKAWYLREW